MSVHTVITCNGYWDGGRMPCRGSFPVDLLRRSDPYDDARRAGWAATEEAGEPDLCPAHTRIERERVTS